MIDKDLIHKPRMWQLIVEISPTELSAMALCPLVEGALQHMAAPLRGESPAERLKALEGAVYDNPGLLLDYGSVTLLWRSQRFALMPDTVTDDLLAARVLHRICPEDAAEAPREVLSDPEAAPGVRLEYDVPEDMVNFVRRTFVNPVMHHALTPQALFFAGRRDRRGRGKMLVNLAPGRMDVVVTGDSAPLLVNTFDCADNADALYYILAIRRALELRPTDEIIVAGDSRRRAALTPLLRRYVAYVMPAIYPAELFRAGRRVLDCPFEVAVTPAVYPVAPPVPSKNDNE